MKTLIIAESYKGSLRPSALSAVNFAQKTSSSNDISILIIGDQLAEAAAVASKYGNVIIAEHPALQNPIAQPYAKIIQSIVQEHSFDTIVAASSAWGKDIIARAAGLLGGAMVNDIIGHEGEDADLKLKKPMYAGEVIATVKVQGTPTILTIRSSAYNPSEAQENAGTVSAYSVSEDDIQTTVQFKQLNSKESSRPDPTEANIIVTGGRAFKNAEDFESHVGALADKLQGATGSSRALVDAGITPNELQIGQTGKIVAPELYIALGVSGAIQHIAGMNGSKVVVAINKDPEAPIFKVADYGIIGDVYDIVPQFIDQLG